MTLPNQVGISKKIHLVSWSLCLGAMGVLLARGWQHFFSQVPYWSWLWDESIMRPMVVEWFGGSWDAYAIGESGLADAINYGIWGLGSWLIITGGLLLFGKKTRKIVQIFLLGSGLILLLHAASITKDHFYRIIQLMEYSLQVGAPLVLLSFLRFGQWHNQLDWTVRILTALTFIGHGWYAIGYYFPRPALFTEMTMAILQVNQGDAEVFLVIMGVLDVMAALLLLLRWKRLDKVAIGYCVIWGFLTALARIWAHFYPAWIGDVLWQWGPEFVLRFPHFFLPLALWYGQK